MNTNIVEKIDENIMHAFNQWHDTEVDSYIASGITTSFILVYINKFLYKDHRLII